LKCIPNCCFFLVLDFPTFPVQPRNQAPTYRESNELEEKAESWAKYWGVVRPLIQSALLDRRR
jgi:hypothetical protein